eukprot:1432948-Pyramimonas_sp.AAC.1
MLLSVVHIWSHSAMHSRPSLTAGSWPGTRMSSVVVVHRPLLLAPRTTANLLLRRWRPLPNMPNT